MQPLLKKFNFFIWAPIVLFGMTSYADTTTTHLSSIESDSSKQEQTSSNGVDQSSDLATASEGTVCRKERVGSEKSASRIKVLKCRTRAEARQVDEIRLMRTEKAISEVVSKNGGWVRTESSLKHVPTRLRKEIREKEKDD